MLPQNPFEILRAALGLGPQTPWQAAEQASLADWAASIEWTVNQIDIDDPRWGLYDAADPDIPIAVFRRYQDAKQVAAILRHYGDPT